MKNNRFNTIYNLLQAHNATFRSKADLSRKLSIIETYANSTTTDTIEEQLIYVEKLLNTFGIHSHQKNTFRTDDSIEITRIGNDRQEIMEEHLEWEEIKRQEYLMKDLKSKILTILRE